MQKIILSFYCAILPLLTFSQEKITGTVRDSNKAAVAYATISIGYGEQTLLSARSNSEGRYELNLTAEHIQKAQWIESKHIAYDVFRKDYDHTLKTVDFDLADKTVLIEDVVVKSRPRAVRSAGDTTRYSVANFASAEDRNIGDVLKRMPGVEVDENGVVKHNGKTVNRMYVDGDHIFQNGYGVGTRTIQPQAVKDVEVVQNHEHKKVRQGVSNSDEVALNLVLHEEAKMTWSGEATLGVAAPLDAYANTNAMSFKKKYKTVNTLQYNAIGESINKDVEAINSFNLIEPIAAAVPNVPTNKYYNNQSLAFNTNQFYKWGEHWTTTWNGNLWADKETLSSNGSQTYFLTDGDQVVYDNYYNTTKKPFFGRGSFTLENNSENYFLKNIVDFKTQKQRHHSWLLDNDTRFDQWGKDRMNYISESIEYIPKMKNKDLMTFNFNIEKQWHEDELRVSPGVMNAYLNQGQPYDTARQRVSLPQITGNMGVAYTRNNTRLKRTYFVNGRYQQKDLNTSLSIMNDMLWSPNPDFPDNNLVWGHKQLSTGVKLDWRNRDFILSASLPLSWNAWEISDNQAVPKESTEKFLFNPSLMAQAYLRNRDYFILSLQFNQHSSDINQMYGNPILSNFREIRSFAAPLYFTDNATYALRYHIERPINLFYANVTASHHRMHNDFLIGQEITQQGIVSRLMPYDNQTSTTNLSAGVSKSILKRGVFAGLNTSVGHSDYNQLLNGDFADATGLNMVISPRVEYKGLPNTTFSYQYTYSNFVNTLTTEMEKNKNSYISNTHSVNALYVIKTSLFIKGSWSYADYKSSTFPPITNGFLDASIRYRSMKSKHSVEFNLNNIFNKRVYSNYRISASQESTQSIPLRGIQGVLKYSFLF